MTHPLPLASPHQGFTLPGSVIVCGDSHTATHGAFGALAFGIGTSEVEHVLATQTLVQVRGGEDMHRRQETTKVWIRRGVDAVYGSEGAWNLVWIGLWIRISVGPHLTNPCSCCCTFPL